MGRRFVHFGHAVWPAMAALLLAGPAVFLYGQAPPSSAEVIAPLPAKTQDAQKTTPASAPGAEAAVPADGPASDSWSQLFTDAPSNNVRVSGGRQFRMTNTPELFPGGEVGFESGATATFSQAGLQVRGGLRAKRSILAPVPGQPSTLSAAARGNMFIPLDDTKLTLRITYPSLVGPGSLAANPHGMFLGPPGYMTSSVGIYTSNGSGLSIGTPSGATFPAVNGQKHGTNTPLVSLKLKF